MTFYDLCSDIWGGYAYGYACASSPKRYGSQRSSVHTRTVGGSFWVSSVTGSLF